MQNRYLQHSNYIRLSRGVMDQAKDTALNFLLPIHKQNKNTSIEGRTISRIGAIDVLFLLIHFISKGGTEPIKPSSFYTALKETCPNVQIPEFDNSQKPRRIFLDKASFYSLGCLISQLARETKKPVTSITDYILLCGIDLIKSNKVTTEQIKQYLVKKQDFFAQPLSKETIDAENNLYTLNKHIEGLFNIKYEQI